MEILPNLLPILGIALCTLAGCQLALWSANSLGYLKHNHRGFQQHQTEFRGQLMQAIAASASTTVKTRGHWRGFRDFRVVRLDKETEKITSVYLVPVDGKPICDFKPGQHLTFRFHIPQFSKPVIRCYSLSAGPGQAYYRISVKEVPAPLDRPELPPGRASQHINRELYVGQQLEAKAPAGDFFLNEHTEKPIVLLAGGVGITPMISMLERLIETNSSRLTLLAYGTNHGGDHAFKKYLADVSHRFPNIHVLNCYSRPRQDDRLGADYQLHGRVTSELLQKVLPDCDCDFYLCGPPPFMKSVYEGLLGWGVDPTNIQYEAFGPASIGQTEQKQPSATNATKIPIKFSHSDATFNWDGTQNCLLEFAETHGVVVDSGCRAGSCGACATEIIVGEFEYPAGQKPECAAGECLLCLARPLGPMELGA